MVGWEGVTRGVVKHVIDKSVPNAVQRLATPSTPKLLEPQERGQRQSQIAALAEDLTGLSKLWSLRDNIAKDNTKIECVPLSSTSYVHN